MTVPPRERRARRIFRLLLRFYPRWFRTRYGSDMTDTFVEAWRGSGGGPGRLVFWIRTLGDAAVQGVSERLSPRRPDASSGSPAGMSGLLADMRFAARSVRRRPGFAMLVAVTLGLGIGANVAVLVLVDAVIFRPLPLEDAERVVEVFETLNETSPRGGMAYATFREMAERETVTEGMAAHLSHDVEVQAGEAAAVARAGLVSGRFFEVVGAEPSLGRALTPADAGQAVTVLSHAFWRSFFGGDPRVLGRTLHVSGSPFVVVGVGPPGFQGLRLSSSVDVWLPVTMAAAVAGEGGILARPDALETRAFKVFDVVARLPEGMDAAVAVEGLNQVRLSLERETIPEGVGRPMSALPVRQAAALGGRDDLVRFLALLAGVVGATFLVACVNVANLLGVRARQRSREVAVRTALGAGRGRLFRELATEALLLGLLGGVAALGASRLTLSLLTGFTLPGEVPVARADLSVGPEVVVLSLLLGLISALLFGIVPAWRASGAGGVGGLRGGGGGRGSGSGTGTGWTALLAVQTGLSVVLLVGAALFGRTLQEALRTDLGFDADSVAALSVRLRPHGLSADEAPATVRAVLSETRARSGAGRAAFALHVPISPRAIALPFEASDGGGRVPGGMNINVVTPEYFEILGIPLRSGRYLEERDDADAPPVIVVNEAAARLMWSDGDVLGRRAKIVFNRDPAEVVGVVGQTRYHDLQEEDVPYVYYPFEQQVGVTLSGASFLARGPRGADEALNALRSAVRSVDPALPHMDGRSVERQVDRLLAPQRFGATLFGLFSALALAISAVGVYGVAAYTVASRRRDIGIRMALGARGREVATMVVGGTLRATLAGLLLGGGLTLLLGDLLKRFLYGVAPLDPLALGVAGATLLVAVLAASAVPARRAVAVDPVESIRAE